MHHAHETTLATTGGVVQFGYQRARSPYLRVPVPTRRAGGWRGEVHKCVKRVSKCGLQQLLGAGGVGERWKAKRSQWDVCLKIRGWRRAKKGDFSWFDGGNGLSGGAW